MDNNRNNLPPRRNTAPRSTEASNNPQPQSRRQNYQPPKENYTQATTKPTGTNFSGVNKNKKLALIGLAALGLIGTAIGISELISNAGKVRILQVQNATVTAQQPYQDCGEVGTTSYSNYHKNGTNGAIIGGVGGAVVGGLVSHSWVGAGVGALVGGVGGDLVQRSYQPSVVAHHSEKTVCHTAYRPIQVAVGYNVQFMDHDDNVGNLVTAHQPPTGEKVPLVELQKDEVTQEQQQQIVQQAINGNNGQQGNEQNQAQPSNQNNQGQ